MTARQQWTTVGAVIVFLAMTLAAATHYLGDELFPVEVGSTAPQIDAVTLTTPKRQKTLDDYKGSVLLVNVWATWCGPCREEMPSLEKLHREFGGRGLKIVAISVDDPGSEAKILEFTKSLGLTFEILHDPEMKTKQNYDITGYPETFIIGREGTIRKKVWGAADWTSDANRALISGLLGDSSASR
ncbi:MAG: TlpA disulfide reductase family protein [Gemmatimonadota bacterium]